MNTVYTLFNDTYVMYQLLDFIDESGIIALCKASKKLNEICKQYIEMEDDKRFGIDLTIYKWANSEFLTEYSINNYVIKIRKIIKMKVDLHWSNGVYGACQGGNIDLAKLMIEKDKCYCRLGLGLRYACESGNIDIVKLMIEKGADDWFCGLENACKGGHIEICKFLIEKGATECWYCHGSMEEHLKK